MYVKVKLAGGDWFSDSDVLWEGEVPGGETIRPGHSVTLDAKENVAVFRVLSCGVRLSSEASISGKSASMMIYVSPTGVESTKAAQSLLG